MVVTKRSHNLNKPAAFSCGFVLVCVTFLLPPGIKGLKIIFQIHPRIKLMGQSKEIIRNWKGPKPFDICFIVNFNCYDQGLVFGGDTGH